MSTIPFLFVLLSIVLTGVMVQTLQKREVQNGEALARTFASSVRTGTLERNETLLDEPFLEALQEPNVVVVAVYFPTGQQLHSRVAEEKDMLDDLRTDLPFSKILAQLETRQQSVLVDVTSIDEAYFYVPIFNKQSGLRTSQNDTSQGESNIDTQLPSETLVGVAEVGISFELVKQTRNQIITFVALMTLIFVGMGSLLLRFIFTKWRAKTSQLEYAYEAERQIELKLRDTLTDLETRNQEIEQTNQELQEAQIMLRNQQAQLVESERLATLGELAGMVAHEINNALSGIGTPTDVIIRTPPLNEELIWDCWENDHEGYRLQSYLDTFREHWANIQEAAEMIQISGARARTVVRDLQGLVGGKSRKFGSVDVKDVLEETLRLQKKRLDLIEITVDADPGTLEVFSTPGQIGQIFMNLLFNAVFALKDKDQPTIAIGIHRVQDGVEIQFADNGCGMPAEIKSRIFEPFFTTKSDNGTGLGLSTVMRIVRDAEGTITVDSEPGCGTIFTIWFPSISNSETELNAEFISYETHNVPGQTE